MKPTRDVIAALLVAAVATVGCSRRDEGSRAKNAPLDPNIKPVKTSGESLPMKPVASSLPATSDVAPAAVPATFADGKAAYASRKYGEATAIFEGYTARRPENAWGHYMLGLSAWKNGDFAKAEGAFAKAIAIDPRHVKSLVNLGRVLVEQKRHDEALQTLTRAAEVDPYSTEVHRLLGRTYYANGKVDEAVESYRRAIELNELDSWSMNNLGLVFLEQQRVEEALPLLTKAVELRKEVPAFHNNLGMALEHAGRFADAAAAYSGALAADPGYETAKRNLERVEAIK